jgi:hypothetical protein
MQTGFTRSHLRQPVLDNGNGRVFTPPVMPSIDTDAVDSLAQRGISRRTVCSSSEREDDTSPTVLELINAGLNLLLGIFGDILRLLLQFVGMF